MKAMAKITLCIMTLELLAACDKMPPEAYYNRGAPESLLDQSSEVVNFEVTSASSVEELVDWVNQDQPSRAELYCKEGEPLCLEAHDVLVQFGVDVLFVSSEDNIATLVYDRVLARDCENRYIDNSINPYNLPSITFGCSMASNILQMTTDKRQFTSPALLDYSDAGRLDRMMRGYRQPYDAKKVQVDPNMDNARDNKISSLK